MIKRETISECGRVGVVRQVAAQVVAVRQMVHEDTVGVAGLPVGEAVVAGDNVAFLRSRGAECGWTNREKPEMHPG
jgi:hypothetical protein